MAKRALEGEALARQLVLASPWADQRLKDEVEAGGVRDTVRARYTVTRAKLRHAASDDARWAELLAQAEGLALPTARPLDEAALTSLDAQLEEAGAKAVDLAVTSSLARLTAAADAQRPKAHAAIDAVDHALKESFTEAILHVYRVALLLTVLALLLTLRLPQLPLRTSYGPVVAE